MGNQITFAGAADGPSADLFDAIRAFARATDLRPLSIEALVNQRGSAAVEGAAERGVEEILCEFGRGREVAATRAAFRLTGSPTRASYLEAMRRLAKRYVRQA
jgi:hypothetical protein